MFFKSIFQCILCMLEGSGALLLLLLFTYIHLQIILWVCTAVQDLYVQTKILYTYMHNFFFSQCESFFTSSRRFRPTAMSPSWLPCKWLRLLIYRLPLRKWGLDGFGLVCTLYILRYVRMYRSMCAICTIVVELLWSSSALKDMGVDCHSAHEQQEMDGRVVSVY